ncbi:helix-turn-helix domain-containing protein [Chloroflexus sp.]|uniref:helix-turn-helix domain-containing protein n=1 Tax=Chloroflexus sp. TaxID=1904827 RepID=UPI00298F32B9|nr:helix-turn-helix domain-containing protein [Chloroflexus sp.]MDW8403837.1 helix-turn-helix domain-containing protein [Chloroflexus sp.]
MRSEGRLASATHGVGEDAQVDVGSRLRSLREQRRMSIRALAEASGLAVNGLPAEPVVRLRHSRMTGWP